MRSTSIRTSLYLALAITPLLTACGGQQLQHRVHHTAFECWAPLPSNASGRLVAVGTIPVIRRDGGIVVVTGVGSSTPYDGGEDTGWDDGTSDPVPPPDPNPPMPADTNEPSPPPADDSTPPADPEDGSSSNDTGMGEDMGMSPDMSMPTGDGTYGSSDDGLHAAEHILCPVGFVPRRRLDLR